MAEYSTGRGSRKHVYGTFQGTYHAQTVIPAENLFLSDNKFYYSIGKTKCKAFRAYFWFENVLDDYSSAGSRVSLQFNGGSSTGIRNVREEYTEKVYDLQGRSVEKPVKGLYIKDGKKVIIK